MQDVMKKDQSKKQMIQQKILRGKHVLLAEDNDLNAEIATAILMTAGLVVDRVEDGLQVCPQNRTISGRHL